jgi:hypothetical protein
MDCRIRVTPYVASFAKVSLRISLFPHVSCTDSTHSGLAVWLGGMNLG